MAEQNIFVAEEEASSSTLLSRAPMRGIIVGVEMQGMDWPVEESLDELAKLASTAGVTTMDRVIQRLAHPHPGMLLGSGKVQEIAEVARFHNCDALILSCRRVSIAIWNGNWRCRCLTGRR